MKALRVEDPFLASLAGALLASSTPPLVYALTRRFASTMQAVMAGLIVSFSNVFVSLENAFMPEPLAIPLSLFSLLLIVYGKTLFSLLMFPTLLLTHPVISSLFLLFLTFYLPAFRKGYTPIFSLPPLYALSIYWQSHSGVIDIVLHSPMLLVGIAVLSAAFLTYLLTQSYTFKEKMKTMKYIERIRSFKVAILALLISLIYFSFNDVPLHRI